MYELFKDELKRLNLLKIKPKNDNKIIKIAIYRNHAFENVASVLNAFLDFSDITAEYTYSDYDDSLNFQVKESDLNILWVDLERYKTHNIKEFLIERFVYLRSLSNKPIFLVYLGEEQDFTGINIPDCFYLCINNIIQQLGNESYDTEKEVISGTRLSSKACILIAQVLGLKYIPSILKPGIKALVLDLDNTLYKGILGEDGIDNIELNEDYKELQQYIKELKNQGFFVCLASKNEEKDVFELFQCRKDFILKWEDFTAVKINWENKAQNIYELSKIMNIGMDSILFVDDNPAEIQNVQYSGYSLKTILAESPKDALKILKLYPGLLKFSHLKEDDIRTQDVQANLIRSEYAKTLSPKEYFEKLGIKLIYSINDYEQIPRVSELFNKTNQFILNYKRYNQEEVFALMQASDSAIITIQMSDKLSDSGIIALLAVHFNDGVLVADDLTVSCRALGRNLENIMIPYMFLIARDLFKSSSNIIINYKKGERNMPALKWLNTLIGCGLKDFGTVEYVIPKNIDTAGLIIEVNNEKSKV